MAKRFGIMSKVSDSGLILCRITEVSNDLCMMECMTFREGDTLPASYRFCFFSSHDVGGLIEEPSFTDRDTIKALGDFLGNTARHHAEVRVKHTAASLHKLFDDYLQKAR